MTKVGTKPKHAGGRPKGSLGDRARSLAVAREAAYTNGIVDPVALLEKLYLMGMKGDVAAIRELGNRLWGQAPQAVEVSGGLTIDTDPEKLAARIAELMERGRARAAQG